MEILISFLVFGYPLGEMGKDTHQFQIVGRAMEESINKEGVLINVESDKKYIQIKSASCCNHLENILWIY